MGTTDRPRPSPDDEPVLATFVSPSPVRSGSPFAAGTAAAGVAPGKPANGPSTPLVSDDEPEAADAGVVSETARGGVLAAALLVPFALLTCWWFPFGGVLISGLGGGLGLFGLASRRAGLAVAFLVVHMALFSVAYWQLI